MFMILQDGMIMRCRDIPESTFYQQQTDMMKHIQMQCRN